MFLRRSSAAFAGGLFATLVAIFTLWVLGEAGLNSRLGIRLYPSFSPGWLYPRLIWGGLWGLLFLLPILKSRLVQRGLLFALVPALVLFFVIFPQWGKDYLGLGYGLLTPALVLTLCFLWGLVTSLWYQAAAR